MQRTDIRFHTITASARLMRTSVWRLVRSLRVGLTCGTMFLTAAVLAAVAAADTIIHVPNDYGTIQEAIDAVSSGDEIVVAPGMYTGPIDMLGKAVHLRSSDGPMTTIIHPGGAAASVVTVASGEGPDTIIEGFTITGGSGTPMPGGLTVGGGMVIHNASPTVINCNFTSNSATYGGAIDVEGGSPTIDGCTFIANDATFGGAVALFDAGATLSNGAFTGNTAINGGAVYLGYFADDNTISHSGFKANHASFRGGAIHVDDGSPVIEQSSFMENTAWQGGAVSIVSAKPMILGSAFTANFGEDSGGAIYNEAASPLISGCTFDGNSTDPEPPSPSSIVVGGGAIGNWWSSNAVIEDSTFTNNTSTRNGGAILYRKDSQVTIVDSTFSNNHAERVGAAAAGMDGVELVIDNSMFIGAEQTQATSELIYCRDSCHTTIIDSAFSDFDETVPILIFYQNQSEVHIAGSTFEDNAAMIVANVTGSGTSISDSTFANNAVAFGPALVAHSGSTSLQLSNTLFCGTDGDDLWGNWDDLGGNEFLETCPWGEQGDSIPGDLNADGVVDTLDMLILLGVWGQCAEPNECPADLNGDGTVDAFDLLILLANWG